MSDKQGYCEIEGHGIYGGNRICPFCLYEMALAQKDKHFDVAIQQLAKRNEELKAQINAVANSIPWEWLEMANIKYGSEIFPDPYKGDTDE